MWKLFAGATIYAMALGACGGDEAAIDQLPNQEACEKLSDAAGQDLTSAEGLDKIPQVIELAEGDLVAPLSFLRDFAERNPAFAESEEDLGGDGVPTEVAEAAREITAQCARAGVAFAVPSTTTSTTTTTSSPAPPTTSPVDADPSLVEEDPCAFAPTSPACTENPMAQNLQQCLEGETLDDRPWCHPSLYSGSSSNIEGFNPPNADDPDANMDQCYREAVNPDDCGI